MKTTILIYFGSEDDKNDVESNNEDDCVPNHDFANDTTFF